VNRREFTLLLGASAAQIALPTKSTSAVTMLSNENVQLNEIRKFWFNNFIENPESYIANKRLNKDSFDTLNKDELDNERVLEFQGVYFSYCELAILASLAPITS
jgi:hypothetical protein